MIASCIVNKVTTGTYVLAVTNNCSTTLLPYTSVTFNTWVIQLYTHQPLSTSFSFARKGRRVRRALSFPSHHTTYSVSPYTILRIIISHTPYHHILGVKGMTISLLEISFNGIFEYGQAYVALSRAVSLEGLSLLNFEPQRIKAHEKVVKFYDQIASKESVTHTTAVLVQHSTSPYL